MKLQQLLLYLSSVILKLYTKLSADSVTDEAVLVPEIPESDYSDEQIVDSVILEESLTCQIDSPTSQENQEIDGDNVSIIIEKKFRPMKQLKNRVRKLKTI